MRDSDRIKPCFFEAISQHRFCREELNTWCGPGRRVFPLFSCPTKHATFLSACFLSYVSSFSLSLFRRCRCTKPLPRVMYLLSVRALSQVSFSLSKNQTVTLISLRQHSAATNTLTRLRRPDRWGAVTHGWLRGSPSMAESSIQVLFS